MTTFLTKPTPRYVCLTHERFSENADPCAGLGGIAMPCEVADKHVIRDALHDAKQIQPHERWRFSVYGLQGDVLRFCDAVRDLARGFVTEDSMGFEVFKAGERKGFRGGSL